ncbi:MAG: pentapeptide repeat-containing protein, partial [Cyanobacteria bacterium J06558_2]
MKASEVLRKYAAGERNFQRVNLRGQSFKGENLSGADFSQANIQGANFQYATLKETKFIRAKAGLETIVKIFLVILSFILSLFAGIASGYVASTTAHFLSSHAIQTNPIPPGLVILLLLSVFFYCLTNEEIENGFTIIAISLALVLPFSPVGAVMGAIGLIGFIAETIAVGIALAIFGSITSYLIIFGSVTTSMSWVLYWIINVARNQSEPLGVILYSRLFFVIVLSAFLLLFSAYFAFESLAENEQFYWTKKIIIRCIGIGKKTTFCHADLECSDFTNAKLQGIDLSYSKIKYTCWENSEGLELAIVDGTILSQQEVRILLVTGRGKKRNLSRLNLKEANLSRFDLTEVNLIEANLEGAILRNSLLINANLKGANLKRAILQNAILEGVELSETLALEADFRGAIMTGVCLENWNANSLTNLDNVNCRYVYLRSNKQERRPSISEFSQGDFTRLFKKTVETVDLIFRNGIDWRSFAIAFQQLKDEQKLKVKKGDGEFYIRAIEAKDDGSFVIRVDVSSDLDKATIEESFNWKYRLQIAELELKLKYKDEKIEDYRKSNTDFQKIIYTLASKDISFNSSSAICNLYFQLKDS